VHWTWRPEPVRRSSKSLYVPTHLSMTTLVESSGRTFTPLPIDSNRGFPQAFPVLFAGQTYRFRLYVNAPASLLEDRALVLDLPALEALLVVQVELESSAGILQPIFLRKVLPELEYEAAGIALNFPQQRVALQNLNGQGNFGSQVTGGIGPRWA
jgi:hypothetical protein